MIDLKVGDLYTHETFYGIFKVTELDQKGNIVSHEPYLKRPKDCYHTIARVNYVYRRTTPLKVQHISSNDGHEAIYIDGQLHDHGETLGEGDSFMYMLKLSEELGFGSSCVSHWHLSDEDDERISEDGSWPESIDEINSMEMIK